MSKDTVFFNEMLIGIQNYQSYSNFCSKYQLWNPGERGPNWDWDNFFLNRIIRYCDSHGGDQYSNWLMERKLLTSEVSGNSSRTLINRILVRWSLMLKRLEQIKGVPLYTILTEHLYRMFAFNGLGGQWLDPTWTVLINPKFLDGLELIPVPDKPIVFELRDRIPIFVVGERFGIVSQNGTLFSDPNFDTSSIWKFLALWEAGAVVEVGNELRPTVDFCRDLADAKSYHQGRVTKVRTHWRMQRRGQGRIYSQRKLIWEHQKRLQDKQPDIQAHLDEAV